MESFLKWAGGKRWLLTKQADILPTKQNIKHYYEPFLGGGSVFFHLKPEKATLSDINSDLINAYQVIKDNWKELFELLNIMHKKHTTSFYYKVRNSVPDTCLEKAARFIYLNRTCFNGLYRVNKKGEFNVPIGSKKNVIMESDDFESLSKLLKNTIIESCDFEKSIDKAEYGDFVFVDPPYTVKHNLNGFVKYNETIFTWKDQIRLKLSVERAIKRGANILITNAHHSSIIDLYAGLGKTEILHRSSVIAGKKNARGIYSEIAIKSW